MGLELGLGLGLELGLGLGLGLRSCGEERKKPKGKVSIAELAATWWRLGEVRVRRLGLGCP